jgi:hypothetical protein
MRSTAVIGLSERRQAARPARRDARTELRRDGWTGAWEEAWPLWPVRLTDGRWCLGLWTTIPVERRWNGSRWDYRERPETDEDGLHRMW